MSTEWQFFLIGLTLGICETVAIWLSMRDLPTRVRKLEEKMLVALECTGCPDCPVRKSTEAMFRQIDEE